MLADMVCCTVNTLVVPCAEVSDCQHSHLLLTSSSQVHRQWRDVQQHVSTLPS